MKGSSGQSAVTDKQFQATMMRWTLAFWGVMYLLFGLRAYFSALGYPLIQAGLRVIMVGVGISLCAILFMLFRRIEMRDWLRWTPAMFAATLAAILVHSALNYVLFYSIAGLRTWPTGPIGRIAGYVVEFWWLYPSWIVLYLILRWRSEALAASSGEIIPEEFWVRSNGVRKRVSAEAITYLESEGDYVRLHMRDGSHLMRSTMAHMESVLEPTRFVRIHRRFIVARPLIESAKWLGNGRVNVTLSTGEVLAVGRHFLPHLKELTAFAGEPVQGGEGPAPEVPYVRARDRSTQSGH